MSAEQLKKLRAEGAFEPMLRFDELLIDHIPYSQLVGVDVESELVRELVEETRCVSVLAPSGAGKSSLIAAAAERLPDDRPPLRIAVGTSAEVAEEPVAFGRHVVREARRLLDAQLAAEDRSKLDVAAAVRKVTARGGSGAKIEVALPPIKGISGKTALELRKSVVQLEEDLGDSGMLEALAALIGAFAGHRLRPVLIFDDTDHWLGRDERGRRVANQFFAGPVRLIAKELDHVSAVVATHDVYTDVPGYSAARSLLVEVEVPRLEPPRDGLAKILGRHVERSGVKASLDEVLENDALVRLEAEYERLNRDLRATLRIAHVALKLAGPSYPERLGVEDIRAAATYLSR